MALIDTTAKTWTPYANPAAPATPLALSGEILLQNVSSYRMRFFATATPVAPIEPTSANKFDQEFVELSPSQGLDGSLDDLFKGTGLQYLWAWGDDAGAFMAIPS